MAHDMVLNSRLTEEKYLHQKKSFQSKGLASMRPSGIETSGRLSPAAILSKVQDLVSIFILIGTGTSPVCPTMAGPQVALPLSPWCMTNPAPVLRGPVVLGITLGPVASGCPMMWIVLLMRLRPPGCSPEESWPGAHCPPWESCPAWAPLALFKGCPLCSSPPQTSAFFPRLTNMSQERQTAPCLCHLKHWLIKTRLVYCLLNWFYCKHFAVQN